MKRPLPHEGAERGDGGAPLGGVRGARPLAHRPDEGGLGSEGRAEAVRAQSISRLRGGQRISPRFDALKVVAGDEARQRADDLRADESFLDVAGAEEVVRDGDGGGEPHGAQPPDEVETDAIDLG